MKKAEERKKEWNRRRGWRLKGRQTDHNQTETSRQLWEQNLILRHRHTNTDGRTHTLYAGMCVCVCVYVHALAQTQAHTGTYTCSHYPKEPHYTWNINGAKQSAKMEMGETEGRRERETEGGWRGHMSLLPVLVWHVDGRKIICILNHHSHQEHDQPTGTT